MWEKIKSLKNDTKQFFSTLLMMSNRGRVNFGSIIGLVIGTIFATVLLVKATPIVLDYVSEASGLGWVAPLVSAVPIVLAIAIFIKIFEDAL